MAIDLLHKQSIEIDINDKDGSYSIQFIGCKLTDAYRVLKNVVDGLESGEFFDEGIATDEDGNTLDAEALKELILRIKAELEADPNDPLPN